MKKCKKFSNNISDFKIENESKLYNNQVMGTKRIFITNKNTLSNCAERKRRVDCLKPVCWIIVPIITAILLVLDALGIYTFNVVRLTVLGIGLLVILLPFFSEITIKDFSFKRSKTKSNINR